MKKYLKNIVTVFLRIFFMLLVVAGAAGSVPASAKVDEAFLLESPHPQHDRTSEKQSCTPNGGIMWVNGPFEPEIAAQVQQKLEEIGVDSTVEARGYGEIDSCGTYDQLGMDFKVTLTQKDLSVQSVYEEVLNDILPVLTPFGKPNLGNVTIVDSLNEVFTVNKYDTPLVNAQALESDTLPTDAIFKQVYVIVYDPLLNNGQTLSEYQHWNDHATITQQTIEFFKQASNNKLNYTVVDTSIVTSGWPELADGFSYTESEYLAVLSGQQPPHSPSGVDYNKIVNSADFDICGKLNRGEIDEVWVYNAPWFGFYESILVGPGAYYLNSPPVSGPHGCNRLLPIMGPSVERTVNEAVHNFTHRTEDIMKTVYGSWQQNNTSHSWNKFALVKAQSPNYSYSGCGSSHYPPNGISDYDYGNVSSVLSNCDDFANYPNLGDPLQVSQPVTCSSWGCTDPGYYHYWFSHFPSNPGCGPDNAANDWWNYIAGPAFALYPSNACQANMRIISGNAGVGHATLTYLDGVQKSVTTDGYGNYFLMVSNQWSGIVTPSSDGGYTFSPDNRSYTDVQSDVYNQDYSAILNGPEINIEGNDISISDGDDTPETTDGTDFGGIPVTDGSVSHTFTVFNTGTGDLNLTGTPNVAISGTHASDFSVTAQPSSPIAPSSSTTFTVVFDPSADGLRSATISIANDDSNEDPYDFLIQGFGGDYPEIGIEGNNTSISDGESTPSPTDHTDFGGIPVTDGSVSHTFTVFNTGTGDLNLTGTPKVTISGTHASDFAVTAQPSSPIAPSGSTTFTVVFDPSAGGLRSASISIANNDANENPYNFSIQGTGAAAYFVDIAAGDNSNSCTTAATPCRNIQEAVDKAGAGDVVYVAGGTYLFSTNATPNVVIINKNLTLSGGWNPGFTSQIGASTIDGANVNNGILAITGTVFVENFIVQNSRSQNSGAIYIVNGNFTLDKSTLRNNIATSNGAGVFLDNGALNIINSTISGNTATSSGGGIYASNNSGTSVTIQNSTIAYNHASTGGGVRRTNGTYNITNTIIANNSSSISSPDCNGTIASANFDIIENMAGCTITSGSNNLNLDPQIDGNLTGIMLVHMPLTGSPAIDAGTASGCPSTDQRDLARPQGASCDIGSVEFGVETVAPTVLSIVRADANPTNAASVNFTVTFSESVTGVDITDFTLTTSGVTGASVTSVNGSGAAYTVTVNTGSGDGTIRLDAVDDDTIVDASGNPLNGGYTNGETYTITREFTLTIVSANGTVAKNPDQVTYHEGDVVQLTATPNSGWSFANWTGDLTSSANPASVTIHGDTLITANYTQNEYTLTINSAHGTVAKNPDQLTYHEGDVVQLTATPDAGWAFLSWTGHLTGSANPASVTIHGDTAITTNYAQILTLNFNSTAANDGWVLESSETSNSGGSLNTTANTFNLGDDKANKQYRGILHFDTSTLPDTAVVTSVTLKIQKQGLVGTDPFTTHDGLLADIQKPYFGTTAGLVIDDFQAVPGQSGAAIFDAPPVSNWYSAMMNSAGYPHINLGGTTQFRLRFTLDDNNDSSADYMKFYSGDAAAANRPQLIIQYYVP